MEAKSAEALPSGAGWRFEPKWDGFRCIGSRTEDGVRLVAKSGKDLTRFFPEIVAAMERAPFRAFVVDGELAIALDGELSFDALQARLHPAPSRIQRLAAETPATYILFDMLCSAGEPALHEAPLTQRRNALERFFSDANMPRVRLSPFTQSRRVAERWLSKLGGSLDGVIAKRTDEPYRAGERAMIKVKRLRTADCVIGGFRYAEREALVGSLLLGLYDEAGRLNHIGFTSGFAKLDRRALTAKLERMRGPGFTGAAPGGPSRWSTARSSEWVALKPALVAEVRYDHVTANRLRHGARFLRWRPDKAPRQCTMSQLSSEAAPTRVIARALEGAPAKRQRAARPKTRARSGAES